MRNALYGPNVFQRVARQAGRAGSAAQVCEAMQVHSPVSQLARQQAGQYGRISFGSTAVSGFDSRLTVTQDDFVNSKDHKSDYKEHKVEDNLTSYFTMCSFWMTGHWTILCNPMCYCQGSFY